MKRLIPLLVIAGVLLSGCPSPRRAEPVAAPATPFIEVAATRGLDFQQHTGKAKSVDIVQTSAGGCGVLDYDGDGRLDIFLVQGQHKPGPGGGNRLYHQLADGRFADVTEKAGVRGHGYGIGCAVGDFDGDDKPDLYVTNNGTCELYHNRGDGTFEDVTKKMGAAVEGCCTGAVFADLDGDGWPDLYVVRYIVINPRSPHICDIHGIPTSCNPTFYDPQPGVFLHNEHGKRFVERTRESGLVNPGRGMCATVGYPKEDGPLALFVTNDTTANELFLQTSPGHFKAGGLLSGVAYGDMGTAEANMGADWGDYDGDGRFDIFVGVMQDRMSLLYHNDGGGLFHLASREAGIADASSTVVSWGAGFLDYDNDGDLDLIEVNGHVHNNIEQVEKRLHFAQPRQLFENTGAGKFVDRTAAGGPAFTLPTVARGAAFGDLDNDGDVDVVVNNLDGAPLILLNQAEQLHHHWLRVRLKGKVPNTQTEGAVVELAVGQQKLKRLCHTAYSYASANDPRVHFGLGTFSSVGPLSIRWPNGKRQEVPVSGVDQEITVQEP